MPCLVVLYDGSRILNLDLDFLNRLWVRTGERHLWHSVCVGFGTGLGFGTGQRNTVHVGNRVVGNDMYVSQGTLFDSLSVRFVRLSV